MLPVGAPVPPKAPCAVPRWGMLICVHSSWHPWVRVAAVGWFLTRTPALRLCHWDTAANPVFSPQSGPHFLPGQRFLCSSPVTGAGGLWVHLSARGVLPALCVLRSGGTRPLQGCRRTPQFYPSCFMCPGLQNTCSSWIAGACFHLCSPSPGSRSV